MSFEDNFGWLPTDTLIKTSKRELPLKDVPVASRTFDTANQEIGVYCHTGNGWRVQPMEVSKRRLKSRFLGDLIKITTRGNKQLLLSPNHLVPVWLPKNQRVKKGGEAVHFVYLCLWVKYNITTVGATDAFEIETLSQYSGEVDYGPRYYWILETTNSQDKAYEKKVYYSSLFHTNSLVSDYESCDWKPTPEDIKLGKKLNVEFGEFRWLDTLEALGLNPAFPVIRAAKERPTLLLNSDRTNTNYPVHELYSPQEGHIEFKDLESALKATCFYNSPDFAKCFRLSDMEGCPQLLPACNLFRGLMVGTYQSDRMLRHRVKNELITKVEKVYYDGEVQSLEIPWGYNFFANDILVVNFAKDEEAA